MAVSKHGYSLSTYRWIIAKFKYLERLHEATSASCKTYYREKNVSKFFDDA